MSTTLDVERAVEQALAADEAGKHDPRIDRMYQRDRLIIYAFVIALWAVLWVTFFLAANPFIEDEALRWLLIGLGAVACIFNSTGMITNTIRLKHESVRFYSQDLYWQDQKKALTAELKAIAAEERAKKESREAVEAAEQALAAERAAQAAAQRADRE
jgi:hypothetical protein